MITSIFVLTSAVLATALPAPQPRADPIKIPVSQAHGYRPRANGEIDSALFLSSLNHTLKKYRSNHFLPTYSKLLSKRASSETLIDQVESPNVDELYYGSGVVGTTTPQTFTIDFDTGSADFFVPGPSCSAAAGCVGTTKYSQDGTDEKNTTSVTYGSGSIEGENYYDQVCVAGLCASHTNVISLTSAAGFSSSASNSLMGFGFSTIANSKQPTFFENLIAQEKVSTPEFAFYLGRAASGTQGNSELTLGGVDATRYSGSFTAVPVTTRGYWQVAVGGAQVNGLSTLPTTQGQAAIDTGTTLILAPTVAALAIFLEVPGAIPLPLLSGSPTETLFAYPCAKPPTVSLVFASKAFAINVLDFNFGTLTSDFASTLASSPDTPSTLLDTLEELLASSTSYCVAAIIADDIDPTENLYVVGDTFLKNWYSVFSYAGSASVSFAKAVGNQ